MSQKILFSNFLEEVEKRIPQKTDLLAHLAEILSVNKSTVYRRLRSDVPFSFYEIMTIAKRLGISLDNMEMINVTSSRSFKLNLIEYINPAETDFALMEEMTAIMKSFKGVPNPEVGEITNILPQPLYVNYKHIFKFYLFKWKYQSNRSKNAIPYKDIVVLDKLQKTQGEYVTWAKRLQTEYIFDNKIFYYLVNSIKYFYNIGLITKEEVLLIKQDLLNILNDINIMSQTGRIKESGKRIDIYISEVNVDTNYIYVSTPDYQLTIIKTFLLNGIASTDKATYEEVRCWVQAAKRQSILITQCGEKERVDFLEEQENLVNSLSLL